MPAVSGTEVSVKEYLLGHFYSAKQAVPTISEVTNLQFKWDRIIVGTYYCKAKVGFPFCCNNFLQQQNIC